ncbi:hypothetical protein [Deinococcus sp. S9]|uniref:hypothetical protein n=1 Tax=Deinococcus sp. S9 TaxID=2545754 RepID=UPI001055411A|nr:hypothetical protein [Deinococcus sp. S9]TDE87412.1 hypothetical protein E0686_02655 [Deinococcus sp. S9]
MSIIERARQAAEERRFQAAEKRKTELLGQVLRILGRELMQTPDGSPAYHFEGEVLVVQELRFRLSGSGRLVVLAWDEEEARSFWYGDQEWHREIRCLADLGELEFAAAKPQEEFAALREAYDPE